MKFFLCAAVSTLLCWSKKGTWLKLKSVGGEINSMRIVYKVSGPRYRSGDNVGSFL